MELKLGVKFWCPKLARMYKKPQRRQAKTMAVRMKIMMIPTENLWIKSMRSLLTGLNILDCGDWITL